MTPLLVPERPGESTLKERLAKLTVVGALCERLPGNKVRCTACAHRCLLKPGRQGICKVRFNQAGDLKVPHGYTGGIQDDPIEKKPFFHVHPGMRTLSFGMLGCDLHCDFCQNWLSSQTLRDEQAGLAPRPITARELVQQAQARGCRGLTSTYNEPLITSEWAVEVFRLAKARGLITAYVSNGHATPEVLDYLGPHLDLMNVDLKCFDERSYRHLGGKLSAVRETITALVDSPVWVEVVTLVVPGFNDSSEELGAMAGFLAGLDPDIPWHVTAFHSDYHREQTPRTPAGTLLKAYEIGQREGLNHIYPGNLPGGVGDRESTFCPACGTRCVRRRGFRVSENRLADTGGKCPRCGHVIAGRWEAPDRTGKLKGLFKDRAGSGRETPRSGR